MRTLFSLAVGLLLLSCQSESNKNKFLQGGAFGTSLSVMYNAPIEEEIIRKGVDSIVEVFNQSVSTYHPESLISKINAGDSTLVVDDIFKEVFLMSKTVYANTNGYFDPTVGVLRNAYGFGDEDNVPTMTQKKLDSIMVMVGFDKVHLKDNITIGKQHPLIYLDFNAIAKGYGVDRIAVYLESLGITNYLVEIGGELCMPQSKRLHAQAFLCCPHPEYSWNCHTENWMQFPRCAWWERARSVPEGLKPSFSL